MKTTREWQIEQVAGIVADHLTEGVGKAEIEAINRDGWTVEIPSDKPGSWMRCEGVVLTPDELERATDMARSWVWPYPPQCWNWIRKTAGDIWSYLWMGAPGESYQGLAEELVELYLEQPGKMPFWWDLEWHKRLVAELREYVDCDLADDTGDKPL